MLNNIKIILVETSHSGNIGSAARAMKTMGLTQLCLVAPKKSIDEQAIALSAGADDVVKNTKIFATIDEAITGCTLVIGTSARHRHLENSLIEPRKCAEKVIEHAKYDQIGIIFGRERIGLTNEELQKCRYHLTIPANPDYSSLNLTMAVQLVSYEIRMAWLKQQEKPMTVIKNSFPTARELEYFYQHTEKIYQQLGFIQNRGVMQKLRRLYNRAELEKNELAILQGMLTAVEKNLSVKEM